MLFAEEVCFGYCLFLFWLLELQRMVLKKLWVLIFFSASISATTWVDRVAQLSRAAKNFGAMVVSGGTRLLPMPTKNLEEEPPILNKRVQNFNWDEFERLVKSEENSRLSAQEFQRFLDLLNEHRRLEGQVAFEAPTNSGKWVCDNPIPVHQIPGMRMAGCGSSKTDAHQSYFSGEVWKIIKKENPATHESDRAVAMIRSMMQREQLLQVDKRGRTFLHWAVEKNFDPMVSVLIQQMPCLIGMEDTEGNTVLHLAAKNGHKEMLLGLLWHQNMSHNILIKKNKDGLDALQLAAYHGYIHSFYYVVEKVLGLNKGVLAQELDEIHAGSSTLLGMFSRNWIDGFGLREASVLAAQQGHRSCAQLINQLIDAFHGIFSSNNSRQEDAFPRESGFNNPRQEYDALLKSLGVDPQYYSSQASAEQLRHGYRLAALRLHPDHNRSQTAENDFKKLATLAEKLGVKQ